MNNVYSFLDKQVFDHRVNIPPILGFELDEQVKISGQQA